MSSLQLWIVRWSTEGNNCNMYAKENESMTLEKFAWLLELNFLCENERGNCKKSKDCMYNIKFYM